jgi:hypothetical protein
LDGQSCPSSCPCITTAPHRHRQPAPSGAPRPRSYTIVGEIRFNGLGEWATARMLVAQFQNVQGSGLDQYLIGHKQVVLYPPEYKNGELEAPFAK